MRILQSALGVLCASLLFATLVPTTAIAQTSADGPSAQDKAMHYSLYWENLKNENYADARNDLRWILDHAPGFPKGDDRNYERAIRLYTGLAEQAEDENKQKAFIDTAATILRTAPEKMEAAELSYDEYEWEIQKGRFLQVNESLLERNLDGLKTAAYHYKKAFELAPDRIDPYYINQVIQNYADASKQSDALAFIEQVEAKRGDDGDVQTILSSARDDIFGKDPKARINFLRAKLDENPDDADLQRELFSTLLEEDYMQEASKMADTLLEQDSLPAEIYVEIANMQLNDGRPSDAASTYETAIENGAELAVQDYFNMGTAHRRVGNLSKARSYYRQAIDKKSDFGKAYIAIGDLYVQAVSNCGGSGNMGRKDKAVYWAAIDMYQRAKQVDASVASSANNNIRTYSQYMPSQEDIFYMDDWEVGGSVRIDYGCYSWINETTTVRKPS